MTSNNTNYVVHSTKVNNGRSEEWANVEGELARFEIEVLSVRETTRKVPNAEGLWVDVPNATDIVVNPRKGHSTWSTAALAQEVVEKYYEGSGVTPHVRLWNLEVGSPRRARTQAAAQRDKLARAVQAVAEASLSNEYDDGNGMFCSTDGCDNLVGGN